MSKVEMTTLDRILMEAKKEFLDKGYQNASLREIVKNAGVTTGAFYGYYKNKEQLFDALVEDVYHNIFTMYREKLTTFFKQSPNEQCDTMQDTTYQCMVLMKTYMYEHYDVMKLLICCSQGTKYSNMVFDLANLDVDATHEFAKNMESVDFEVKGVHAVLERVLTKSMFQG